ncbi:MAG: 16S rRNA (guanine(966)-N(2))-methyltransferase RsmD [bacterium]
MRNPGRDERVQKDRGRSRRVRPTQQAVRDALFNSLGARVPDARVLDLFAGTGSLGLEALRRGARFAVFVEQNSALAAEIREQLAAEGMAERAEVWRRDAIRVIRELGSTGRQFDIVVADPPYGEAWIPRVLRAIMTGGILAPSGVIVAEGHWRDKPESEPGLVCYREAKYGETTLWFYRPEGG